MAEVVKCKDVKCTLKGYWIETRSDGSKVICFKTPHHKQKHQIEITKTDIEEIFKINLA